MRFGTYLQSHFIFKNRERLFLDLYLPPMGRGERLFDCCQPLHFFFTLTQF